MMRYIVIFNPTTTAIDVLTDEKFFIEEFPSYEEAYEAAKQHLEEGDDFSIYVHCTEERNHII